MDLQVVEGGGEVVIMGGGLVLEGTLVVEAGTRIQVEGPVVLEPTMQLEIVLLDPEILENSKVEIIFCTPFTCLCLSLSSSFSYLAYDGSHVYCSATRLHLN